jgi:hypothetical protein
METWDSSWRASSPSGAVADSRAPRVTAERATRGSVLARESSRPVSTALPVAGATTTGRCYSRTGRARANWSPPDASIAVLDFGVHVPRRVPAGAGHGVWMHGQSQLRLLLLERRFPGPPATGHDRSDAPVLRAHRHRVQRPVRIDPEDGRARPPIALASLLATDGVAPRAGTIRRVPSAAGTVDAVRLAVARARIARASRPTSKAGPLLLAPGPSRAA